MTTIENQKGYRGHQGALWAPRGVGAIVGMSGHQGCRGVRGVLGADRDSRYSGARRV